MRGFFVFNGVVGIFTKREPKVSMSVQNKRFVYRRVGFNPKE